jgi:hypothetical protein
MRLSIIVHATMLFARSAVGRAYADDSPVKQMKHVRNSQVADSTPETLPAVGTNSDQQQEVGKEDEAHWERLLQSTEQVSSMPGAAVTSSPTLSLPMNPAAQLTTTVTSAPISSGTMIDVRTQPSSGVVYAFKKTRGSKKTSMSSKKTMTAGTISMLTAQPTAVTNFLVCRQITSRPEFGLEEADIDYLSGEPIVSQLTDFEATTKTTDVTKTLGHSRQRRLRSRVPWKRPKQLQLHWVWRLEFFGIDPFPGKIGN